jgi:hypothetical protein
MNEVIPIAKSNIAFGVRPLALSACVRKIKISKPHKQQNWQIALNKSIDIRDTTALF